MAFEPSQKMQNSQENYSVVPPLNESMWVKKLWNIIDAIDKEKQRLMQQMPSEMKEERAILQEEAMSKMVFEHQLAKKLFGVKGKKKASRNGKTTNKSRKRPANPAHQPK